MKRLLFVWFFLFLTTLTTRAQELGKIENLDEKNGFKNILLGEVINSDKYKYIGNGDGNSKFYDLITNDLKIGQIPIESISIISYENRVHMIVVYFEKKHGISIENVLYKAYGLYTERPNRFMDVYKWESNKVKMKLDYDDTTENASLVFISKPISDLIGKEIANSAKKAVEDL